jgi:hypothetical protein
MRGMTELPNYTELMEFFDRINKINRIGKGRDGINGIIEINSADELPPEKGAEQIPRLRCAPLGMTKL